jgi:hypothetical protein
MAKKALLICISQKKRLNSNSFEKIKKPSFLSIKLPLRQVRNYAATGTLAEIRKAPQD